MERAAAEDAATLGGLAIDPETDFAIAGNDPVLETPFHVGEGAAVALTLVGQAANRIWMARGGTSQSLAVDVRHAAASLRSYAPLELDGVRLSGEWHVPGLTNPWLAADDRYIHLHSSFRQTLPTLAELGLAKGATDDEIGAAVRKRDAFELEDTLAAQGLCATVCRTAEEWAAHPQGAIMAGKPVVELIKIGDAPAEPFLPGARPLHGIRVLDLTRVLAGPTCARTLAEHGADVLHIAAPHLPTRYQLEIDTGHGKRQAHIDLNGAEEADTLRGLVREADVFSEGFQLGSLARRGFGAEEVAKLRPGIVYVTENCYGQEGPWARRPGWEQLAQAASGVMLVHGGDRPRMLPAGMNDYTTGYFGALGAMMALERRAREGGSWLVRVSLVRTSMWYYALGHDLDPTAAQGEGDLAPLMDERETGYGRVRFLRPALQMSETTPAWALPTAPLGSGSPSWL